MAGKRRRGKRKNLDRVIDTLQKVGFIFFCATVPYMVLDVVLVYLGVFNAPKPSPWVWIFIGSQVIVWAVWIICFVVGWILVGIDLSRSGTFRTMKRLESKRENRR
jgi:hypothetical protein